jgi:hypothetical protein
MLYPAASTLHVPAPALALFHGSLLPHYIRHHHMLQMLAPSLLHVPVPSLIHVLVPELALFHGRFKSPPAVLDLGSPACIMA